MTHPQSREWSVLYPVVQVWDFSKLQDQLSSEHSLPCDWVRSTLTVCLCGVHSALAVISTCYAASHENHYGNLLQQCAAQTES